MVDVVTEDGALLGRVVSCDETTLALRISPDADVDVPVDDIQRIDAVQSRGAEGALIGGLLGAIPLAALSAMIGDWVNSGIQYYFFVFAVLALPVVGGLGLIGGIIGLAMKKRQRIFVAPASV